MRPLFAVVTALALMAVISAAEDQPEQEYDAPGSAAANHTYVVQLTEFRMKSAPDQNLNAEDIERLFDQAESDDELDLIETVRLSVLAGHESLVQFGRRASVETGTHFSAPGRPPTRQTQMQEIGTLVRAQVDPQADKVLISLSYEASRFDGEGTDDMPPQTVTVQIHTKLLLTPGKPMLLGGLSTEESGRFLLISITQQPL